MLDKTSRMLKYLVLVLTILVSYHAVEAHDKALQTKNFYKSIKQDVTGDKKADQVELKGKISKKNKKWVKALKLTVKSNNSQIISIPLKSGSYPTLAIEDFNHDGIKDVLVTVKKHNNSLFSKIYSFNGEHVTKLDLPPPILMTGQFQNQYIAEISVEGQKTVRVDLRRHQDFYEKLGIYDHGKLNEAMELIVDPYSEFIVSSSLGRDKGILGIQTIKGIDRNDAIATISTSWTFSDGDWKLQKIKVKPAKSLKIITHK